jgi:GMP synthase-like glutamine amidotransferase
MALLVFIHHPQEGPGILGDVLRDCGHQLREVRLFDRQGVPPTLDDVAGIISMGGPMNVDEAAEHAWIDAEMVCLKKAHGAGLPIVGVCLGAQLIGAALGGQVAAMPKPPGPEVGFQPVRLTFPGTNDPLLAGIPWTSTQFHLHGQEVVKLPPEGVPLVSSKMCKTQAFRVGQTTYGFQYHFEWDREDLAQAAADGLVAKAGLTAQGITASIASHYDGYRRLGDRLCANIAMMLF